MLRNLLYIALSLFAVMNMSAQDRIDEILSGLSNGFSETALDFVVGDNPSALDYVAAGNNSALDFIITDNRSALDFVSGVSGSPLDYIAAGNYYSSSLRLYSSSYASNGYSQYMNFGQPAFGRITSGFGYREKFHRMHKGIDIAMAVGDTVRVMQSGTIDRVNYEPGGYGNYIVVTHDDGMETRYAHLSRSLVTPGMRVSANQPIALSGNTGNSTGPHLHFETRFNGIAVDPRSVFDFTGVANGGFLNRSGLRYNGGYESPAAQSVEPSQPDRFATGFSASRKPITGKSTYVVRAGDTLKKIAARAGISVARLCSLNMISENAPLETGRMLKLR